MIFVESIWSDSKWYSLCHTWAILPESTPSNNFIYRFHLNCNQNASMVLLLGSFIKSLCNKPFMHLFTVLHHILSVLKLVWLTDIGRHFSNLMHAGHIAAQLKYCQDGSFCYDVSVIVFHFVFQNGKWNYLQTFFTFWVLPLACNLLVLERAEHREPQTWTGRTSSGSWQPDTRPGQASRDWKRTMDKKLTDRNAFKCS